MTRGSSYFVVRMRIILQIPFKIFSVLAPNLGFCLGIALTVNRLER